MQLKSNFLGSEYLLTGDCGSGRGTEEELFVNYKPTSAIEGAPRTMLVVSPSPVGGSSAPAPEGGLAALMEQARSKTMAPEQERRLALLCTKPPEYIEATKCERRGRGSGSGWEAKRQAGRGRARTR